MRKMSNKIELYKFVWIIKGREKTFKCTTLHKVVLIEKYNSLRQEIIRIKNRLE